MRVTTVALYSEVNTEPINFSLRDNDPSAQYNVRSIIGLDAEDITRRFYGWGANTNKKFYDYNLKPRDIVMRIVLKPRFELDESYSDIRDELYRTISPDRGGIVTLHFKSGGTTVSRISGYINKFEVAYFNKLPEVQITIHCDDPIFRAINPVSMDVDEIGIVNPIKVPDSLSTAPHGLVMVGTFDATSPSFVIQDTPSDPEWTFTITPSGGFLVGDELHISTEFSNRYVYMIRSSTVIQLIDKIAPNSVWPTIFPGSNEFHFVDLDDIDWESFEFYAAYWGV